MVIGSLSLQATASPSARPLDVKIADMEWAIWVLIAMMLGLYVWSHRTAGHEMSKKLQPFVDDLFGTAPSKRESKGNPPTKSASDGLPRIHPLAESTHSL
jgi:hypothetical protein